MTASQGETLIRVEQVSISYGDRVALENVSLELHAGEVVSLVGPNGAGKSTLLKAIAGLVRLDSGRIVFSPSLGHDHRHCVIYVPQRDKIDWTLPASVRDLVLMGSFATTSRWRRLGREQREAAERALN